MKYATYIIKIFLALFITYLITNWWLNTWWSERYWTWLNIKFGQNFGLASDVEIVTVLIVSLFISIVIVMLLFRVLKHIQNYRH